VIATHDQGVIAVVHPRAELAGRGGRPPGRHLRARDLEIGDIDGDGVAEFFATPSKPNKLDQEQPARSPCTGNTADGKWQKSIVDAPGDTHAKEILVTDIDATPSPSSSSSGRVPSGAGGRSYVP
jgi:hypothetical protein